MTHEEANDILFNEFKDMNKREKAYEAFNLKTTLKGLCNKCKKTSCYIRMHTNEAILNCDFFEQGKFTEDGWLITEHE